MLVKKHEGMPKTVTNFRLVNFYPNVLRGRKGETSQEADCFFFFFLLEILNHSFLPVNR